MSIQSTFIDLTLQRLKDSLLSDGTVSFKHMMRLASVTETVVYVMGPGGRMFSIISQIGECIKLSPVGYPDVSYVFKEQQVLLKEVVTGKALGWTLSAYDLERGKVELFVILQEGDIYKRFQELLTPPVSSSHLNHASRAPDSMLPLEDRIETLEKEIAELKNKADAQDTINQELLVVVRLLAELARPRSTGILS